MIVARTNVRELYVSARLDAWGKEFSMHDSSEPHGITVTWLLVKYGGEIPRVEGGRAPEQVNEQAYEIERIIAEMHRIRPVDAWVMRAYYGWRGRHKVERREFAQEKSGVRISAAEYFRAHDRGYAWVTGALMA